MYTISFLILSLTMKILSLIIESRTISIVGTSGGVTGVVNLSLIKNPMVIASRIQTSNKTKRLLFTFCIVS